MPHISQFVQSFVRHDAISTHARHLRRICSDMGLGGDIYAGEEKSGRDAARFFRDFQATGKPDDNYLLFHLSTGGAIADFLIDRPEKVVIDYHNITPAELFAPWAPHVGIELEAGRRQLAQLAPVSVKSVAVSHYNAEEMVQVGYDTPAVAPVLFDPADFERELDGAVDDRLKRAKGDGGSDWLFVGRIAPNKCQQDIIKAFAVYRKLYDPRARLHLVGGISSHHYWTVLRQYIDALALGDCVDLTGGVSNGALAAYYKNADIFVCLSEHEGFCVPLLEAMYNRLPIVAFAAAAVPETLGGAGLVLSHKQPSEVAVAAQRVLSDVDLSDALTSAGTNRLSDFALDKSEAAWRNVLADMVETA